MPDRDAGEPAAGDAARLCTAAAALGVTLAPDQVRRLLEFGALLSRHNRAFNLVSRRDVGRLVPRHLLDSLSVAPLLRGATVMDLGTGAGLPGVPLALAREELRFVLVDRSERKIRFVARAARALGLDNVETWCGDIEHWGEPSRFDTIVSRAVAEPARLWTLAAPRLAAGGVLVIMHRGRSEATPSAAQPPLPVGVDVVAERTVQIPGLDRPHEILVLAAQHRKPLN